MTEDTEMSDASADAMVQAMMQSWKRSIDELDRLRVENETLRKIVSDCIEQGTDGHAHPACSLEFLSYAPREVAAVKRQRDEARADYAELLAQYEKLRDVQPVVQSGSLPAHLRRAEEREFDRLRAIEAAARKVKDKWVIYGKPDYILVPLQDTEDLFNLLDNKENTK